MTMTTKKCCKCKVYKPLSEFGGITQVNYACKVCEHERAQRRTAERNKNKWWRTGERKKKHDAYRKKALDRLYKNKHKQILPTQRMFIVTSSQVIVAKLCTNCEHPNDIESFWVRSANRNGLSSWCKDCMYSHTSKYNKVHRDEMRERERRYREANRDKFQKKWRRRYAREQNCKTFRFLDSDWHKLLLQYDYRCFYCQSIDYELTLDHKIPISRGGDHSIGNAIPACRSCNASKGNLTPIEFRNGVKATRK